MTSTDIFFFAATTFADKPPTFPAVHGGYNGGGWAHLPKFILFYLLKFLNLRTDLFLLRAVCRSWRSALPLNEIPKLPLGFDAPKLPSGEYKNLPVLLYYARFFLLSPLTKGPHNESNSPWIVRVSDVTHQLDHNEFKLQNVLDGSSFFVPEPPLKGKVNLVDCNVLELSSCFTLLGGQTSLFNTELKHLSEKIVGNWDFNSMHLFAVLVKINAVNGGGLIFLKMGLDQWVKFEEMKVIGEKKNILKNFDVGDIVFYDAKFYAFDVSSWKVGIIDLSDFDFDDVPSIEFIDGPKIIHQVIHGVHFGNVDGVLYAIKGFYFVPSKDGLYLVFEMSGYDDGIKETLIVYELDEEEWEWNRVESIGQQIFFIGVDAAFSIPAKKLPLWKPGTICLFTRWWLKDGFVEVGRGKMPNGLEMLDGLKYPKYWKGFRMFNMEEEEKGIVGFEELSTEVYTGLFFPPPPWVKWTCPMFDDVEVKLMNLKLCDDVGVNVAEKGAKFSTQILEEVE